MRPETIIAPRLEALSERLAEETAAVAAEAIGARGRFSFCLAGGSTPRRLYRLLGSEPLARRIEWEKVFFFWGDERVVAPDDERSNYGMARAELLSRIGAAPANVFRIAGELPPAEAAADYERKLKEFFNLRPGQAPPFDLALLGIGEDGHTASIFPGSPALSSQRLVEAVYAARLGEWRVTLTPRGLSAARALFFLASGRSKAAVVRRLLEDRAADLPVTAVRPSGRLLYWLDAEAAGDLPR